MLLNNRHSLKILQSKAKNNLKQTRTKSGYSQTQTAIIVIGIFVTIIVVFGVIFLSGASGSWGIFNSLRGSGDLITEEKTFTDFSILDISRGFDVTITQSDSYSIIITADENVIDKILVTKTGERLSINLEPGFYESLTLRTEITMPQLNELDFSGGTHGTAKGFSASENLVLSLSGGSRIEVEGSANDLSIDASGGSQLTLSDFTVHNADVQLSGGSRATINLDGRLDANVSGGSTLYYIGEPTESNIDTSGGSTVRKR